LSDRFGRRLVIVAGWAVALPWSLTVLPLIEAGSAVLFTAAIVGTYGIAPTPR
jgi:hypothetical protein